MSASARGSNPATRSIAHASARAACAAGIVAEPRPASPPADQLTGRAGTVDRSDGARGAQEAAVYLVKGSFWTNFRSWIRDGFSRCVSLRDCTQDHRKSRSGRRVEAAKGSESESSEALGQDGDHIAGMQLTMCWEGCSRWVLVEGLCLAAAEEGGVCQVAEARIRSGLCARLLPGRPQKGSESVFLLNRLLYSTLAANAEPWELHDVAADVSQRAGRPCAKD